MQDRKILPPLEARRGGQDREDLAPRGGGVAMAEPTVQTSLYLCFAMAEPTVQTSINQWFYEDIAALDIVHGLVWHAFLWQSVVFSPKAWRASPPQQLRVMPEIPRFLHHFGGLLRGRTWYLVVLHGVYSQPHGGKMGKILPPWYLIGGLLLHAFAW